MIRRRSRFTGTGPLFPYPPLFRSAALVFAQAFARGIGLAFGEQLAHALQPGLPYLRRVGRGRRLVLEGLVDRGRGVEGVDARAGDLDPVERAGDRKSTRLNSSH